MSSVAGRNAGAFEIRVNGIYRLHASRRSPLQPLFFTDEQMDDDFPSHEGTYTRR